MGVTSLFSAAGGAKFYKNSVKCIRFAYHGCANRPFYHIVVMEKRRARQGHVIEQLGTFDPMENVHGEKLCALNLERITHWMGDRNTTLTKPCAELFGLAGLLPIHPKTYMKAWQQRRRTAEQQTQDQQEEEAQC